jgi:spore coat polysaccharide biosynthesis protein SpsF
MRVVAIIQARTGSTRLPGKVLADLAGEPMLARVVNRTRRAKGLDEVVIATTNQPADDAIVEMCVAREWAYFRGSENDVLDRYYQAALKYHAQAIVRITSDCPLIDPEILDSVVQAFLDGQPEVDYISNAYPRATFPRGLDTEVMRLNVLEQAWREDRNLAWREHVTTFILRNPNLFRLDGILHELDLSDMRWTVDTPEDLVFVRRIYDTFNHDSFSWRDVVSLLKKCPQWLDLNRHVQQKIDPGH